MDRKKIIIVIFVCTAMGGISGFLINKFYYCKKDPNDTFLTGWEAARQRLKKYGPSLELKESFELKSISGIIKNINGNDLLVEILPYEVLSDPNLDERIVKVTNDTRITMMSRKSEEKIQEELNQTEKNVTETTPEAIDAGGIKLYQSEDYLFEKLEKDDQIRIETDVDIRNLKSFEAKEIVVIK